MKFIELFAGIGGMGYGLTKVGMECVGFCEIDKYAHQAYNVLHNKNKNMWEGWDVRDVTDDDIRSIERERGKISLIAAGFPCQSFSIAGRRRGFDDTRGTLIYEVFRFASILKPKYLLLENVKGLLSHDKGRTFGVILSALDELGYNAEWQVLNSKNFGVPQNRERIFIIGHLRGEGSRKVFPIRRENDGTIEVIGRLDSIKGKDLLKRIYNINNISPCLQTMQGGSQEPKILININNEKLKLRNDETSTCLDANYFKGIDNHGARTGVAIKEATKKGYDIAFEGDSINILQPNSQTRRGRIGKKIANTLETKCNQGTLEGYRIRKLTPLECFRLQSFPDDWYYELKENNFSDTQMYKMAGNAVTSLVTYVIGRGLIEHQ